MVVPFVSHYLRWLQRGNPVGTVEAYPEVGPDGSCSLPGVYVVGDLTGVPLLKLASEGGARVVETLLADADFQAQRRGASGPTRVARGAGSAPGAAQGTRDDRVRDVIIVGGGPAGIACALECARLGLDYLLLESSRLFCTLEDFPAGKPILAKPDGYPARSPLRIADGSKESLLADLRRQLAGRTLEVREGARVERLRRAGDVLAVATESVELRALRVVLALGKTGDPRRLGVPGEELPHVRHRLIDPAEHSGSRVLVAGGGDAAVEAAIALAESGNQVTLVHRGASLDRPQAENRERLAAWTERGRVTVRLRSRIEAIRPGEVALASPRGAATEAADQVYVLIGREIPRAFLRRSGIRLAGEKDLAWKVFLAASFSFFSMLYFGKAGVARDLFQGAEGPLGHALAYLAGPFPADIRASLSWSAKGHAWYASLNFVLGWAASLAFLVAGPWALLLFARKRGSRLATAWGKVKYGYLAVAGLAFTAVYFHFMLTRNAGWVEGPTYWYSLLYCVTLVLFGVRRMAVRRTRYIRRQVLALIAVQVFFLFLLPFHLFDPLLRARFAADSFVMREMFPQGKWSSFAFVLFWPLDMNAFGTSAFWTWFPFVQTFGILFVLVRLWGKGAYCGWICSCGGLAETLGDEYRAEAPHGRRPKRLEHLGQAVLAFALMTTAVGYAARQGWLGAAPLWADTVRGAYKLSIDVVFAGVVGLGAYFFLSGRVWCRFGCPLAALMHVYARFSKYRIFAEKEKCISCNQCTRACHMGIDVMGYANKGVPMDDVQCVRCSACVTSCPTEVLAFGALAKPDTRNRSRKPAPDYPKTDWRAGLR